MGFRRDHRLVWLGSDLFFPYAWTSSGSKSYWVTSSVHFLQWSQQINNIYFKNKDLGMLIDILTLNHGVGAVLAKWLNFSLQIRNCQYIWYYTSNIVQKLTGFMEYHLNVSVVMYGRSISFVEHKPEEWGIYTKHKTSWPIFCLNGLKR